MPWNTFLSAYPNLSEITPASVVVIQERDLDLKWYVKYVNLESCACGFGTAHMQPRSIVLIMYILDRFTFVQTYIAVILNANNSISH